MSWLRNTAPAMSSSEERTSRPAGDEAPSRMASGSVVRNLPVPATATAGAAPETTVMASRVRARPGAERTTSPSPRTLATSSSRGLGGSTGHSMALPAPLGRARGAPSTGDSGAMLSAESVVDIGW